MNKFIKKRKELLNKYVAKKKFFYKYKSHLKIILLLILIIESLYKRHKKNYLIKVAYYCNSFKNGGIERVIYLLIKYISKEYKFRHYLITNKDKSEGEYLLDEKVQRISLSKEHISLIRAVKTNHIDILIYNYYDPTQIKKLNKMKRTKIICYDHSSYFFWIYQNIFNFKDSVYNIYQKSNYIISLIPFEHDYLFKKWGINSILMDNPLTFEYDSVIPSDLESNNIIMIGRANDIYKRFDLGIHAMTGIIKEVPKCEMNILSFSVKKLEDMINELNLTESIRFLGYHENIEIYLKNSSLHILPSISEAYPMVLSETKIFGIPSIIIGLDYLALSKKGTIIIYDDEPDSIAKEAIKILKNKTYRKKLGEEARISMKNIKNSLIAKRWVKILLAVYNENKLSSLNLSGAKKTISNYEAEKILYNQLIFIQKRINLLRYLSFENLLNYSLI